MDAKNQLIEPLLTAFAQKAKISLLVAPQVLQGQRTTCTINSTQIEQTLICLLAPAKLQFERLPTGTYLISRSALSVNTHTVQSAPRGAVKGVVKDGVTGAVLPYATIFWIEGQEGTLSNASGYFGLEGLPMGKQHLQVRFVGYKTVIISVDIQAQALHQWREMALAPIPIEVAPVVVERPMAEIAKLGLEMLAKEVITTPRGWGTPDALYSSITLAGVHIHDALGEVHIQGGESGEHFTKLDGVPIFEPLHLRGLVSAFSPFALSHVIIHKAGFGASAGSSLAGMMEMQHNLQVGQASKQTLETQLDAQAFNGRWAGEYLFGNKKLKAMLGGRLGLGAWYQPTYVKNILQTWSQPDAFLPYATIIPLIEENPVFYVYAKSQQKQALAAFDETQTRFNDGHFAMEWQPRLGQKWYASGYAGQNHLDGNALNTTSDSTSTRDTYTWGNRAFQLKGQALLSAQTLAWVRLRHSRYALKHQYNFLDNTLAQFTLPNGAVFELKDQPIPADDGNAYAEQALEVNLETNLNDAVWQGGFSLNRYQSEVKIQQLSFKPVDYAARGFRLEGFIEGQKKIGKGWLSDFGLRATWLRMWPIYLEPRLALQMQKVRQHHVLKARFATGLYRQFVNKFEVSSFSPNALLPSVRFWLPVSDALAPPRAWHGSVHFEWQTPKGVLLKTELYYKHQSILHLVDYAKLWQYFSSRTTASQQEDFLIRGQGRAWGSGIELRYQQEDWQGSLRYEFSQVLRKSMDEAAFLAAPWSEPHQVFARFDLRPHQHLRLSIQNRAVWQRTWGFRRAYYDYLRHTARANTEFGGYDLANPEEHILPPLLQLDLGLIWTNTFRKGAKLQARADLLNVLNRKNVAEWWLSEPKLEGDGFAFDRINRNLTPLIPAFSLSITL